MADEISGEAHKASGMPAWSAGGIEDAGIWDLAAFLQKLPLMTKVDYDQLVAASDGHSHGGMTEHDQGNGHAHHHAEPPQSVTEESINHSHDHGSHEQSFHKH